MSQKRCCSISGVMHGHPVWLNSLPEDFWLPHMQGQCVRVHNNAVWDVWRTARFGVKNLCFSSSGQVRWCSAAASQYEFPLFLWRDFINPTFQNHLKPSRRLGPEEPERCPPFQHGEINQGLDRKFPPNLPFLKLDGNEFIPEWDGGKKIFLYSGLWIWLWNINSNFFLSLGVSPSLFHKRMHLGKTNHHKGWHEAPWQSKFIRNSFYF